MVKRTKNGVSKSYLVAELQPLKNRNFQRRHYNSTEPTSMMIANGDEG
jgi:hypothetical protein